MCSPDNQAFFCPGERRTYTRHRVFTKNVRLTIDRKEQSSALHCDCIRGALKPEVQRQKRKASLKLAELAQQSFNEHDLTIGVAALQNRKEIINPHHLPCGLNHNPGCFLCFNCIGPGFGVASIQYHFRNSEHRGGSG